MPKQRTMTEAAILDRVVSLAGDLTPEAARGLLTLRFDAQTTRLIRRLLQQNNRGTISAEDRLALEKYLRIGQFLDLLQAKARQSLIDQGAPV
jgi:hypothetical protein